VKLLKQGLALVVMGAGLAATPLLPVQAEPSASSADDRSVQAMKNRADGLVSLSGERATDRVGFIRVKGDGDLMPGRAASSPGRAPKLAA
jgi:hypothetical protein